MRYHGLCDGDYALHRMLHAPALKSLQTSAGVRAGGVFGFLKFLSATTRSYSFSSFTVVFGSGRSRRRLSIYPEYKQRPPPLTDEEREDKDLYYSTYIMNKSILIKILALMGIRVISVLGEADDALALLTSNISIASPVLIVSDDKDFLSLVDDRVSVYRPMAEEHITVDNFKSMTGVETGSHYLLYKAVVGDQSDNIGGVPGVGATTIKKILVDLEPSISALRERAAAERGKRAKALLENIDIVERNLDLMDMSRELTPYEQYADMCVKLSEPVSVDRRTLYYMLQNLEFMSLLESISSWLPPFERLT